MNNFFWLHVKKCAGQSTRKALKGIYTEADRSQILHFCDVSKGQWNDVINNYRVVIGRYQFRRSEYAKRYLYPNGWDKMLRVAFSRNPIDRCLSMFNYLYNPLRKKGRKKYGRIIFQT